MKCVPGMYFRSADEANEWLCFDEVGVELDIMSDWYPDTYEEWIQWRDHYNAQEILSNGSLLRGEIGNAGFQNAICRQSLDSVRAIR